MGNRVMQKATIKYKNGVAKNDKRSFSTCDKNIKYMFFAQITIIVTMLIISIFCAVGI